MVMNIFFPDQCYLLFDSFLKINPFIDNATTSGILYNEKKCGYSDLIMAANGGGVEVPE
jgi:hypothetical protein